MDLPAVGGFNELQILHICMIVYMLHLLTLQDLKDGFS